MLSAQRKAYILEKLDHVGIIRVNDIAKELKTSLASIRRDLSELEAEEKIHRIHGGATKKNVTTILTENNEIMMSDRLFMNYDKKSKICRYASNVVKDGECIFLDGGTSIVPMIYYLAKRPVKIVTHNHLLVDKIQDPVANIIVIGGEYHAKYSMSYGPIAQSTLKLFNFDRAFIGCVGMDPIEKKAYTAEMDTRKLKMIAMHNANHNYLLIDDTKLSIKGFCLIDSTDRFEKIFCNASEAIHMVLPDNVILV